MKLGLMYLPTISFKVSVYTRLLIYLLKYKLKLTAEYYVHILYDNVINRNCEQQMFTYFHILAPLQTTGHPPYICVSKDQCVDNVVYSGILLHCCMLLIGSLLLLCHSQLAQGEGSQWLSNKLVQFTDDWYIYNRTDILVTEILILARF